MRTRTAIIATIAALILHAGCETGRRRDSTEAEKRESGAAQVVVLTPDIGREALPGRLRISASHMRGELAEVTLMNISQDTIAVTCCLRWFDGQYREIRQGKPEHTTAGISPQQSFTFVGKRPIAWAQTFRLELAETTTPPAR